MKYIDALKKYNEGKDKWCMPRKGSEDYLNIIKMVKKISNIKKAKGIKIKDKNVITLGVKIGAIFIIIQIVVQLKMEKIATIFLKEFILHMME